MKLQSPFSIKEQPDVSLIEIDDIGIYAPTIAEQQTNQLSINPGFKGEVQDRKVKFPKELGIEHPFDYTMTEGLYKSVGLISGAINKLVNAIWGSGINTKSVDPKAKTIIDDWRRDTSFEFHARKWTKMALMDGMSPMELGGGKDETVKGIKILDSKSMYVDRDKKGKVKGWNQFTGNLNSFTKKDERVIPFKPHQIADLQLNVVGDEAYGIGIVWPARVAINNLIASDKDLHLLMKRKANAPIHAKIGNIEHKKMPTPEAVAAFGAKLEWLNNKHEWATDALVDMKVLDFGNIGEKFDTVLKNDIFMILAEMEVPIVLMGMDNVPEGLAAAQLEGLKLLIHSYQEEIEKVIENKIFRRVLDSNGIASHVEIEWGQPSEKEKNERLLKLKEILALPDLNPGLRRSIEKEMAILLGIDVEILESAEEERKREEDKLKQPIVPGQNNPKENFDRILCSHDIYNSDEMCEHCESMDDNKDWELKEWLGFDYQDYKKAIDIETKNYDFKELKATNDVELKAGRLTDPQVEELRIIMRSGFKDEKTLNEMSEEINSKVKPKDLFQVKDNQIVIRKDGSGPKMITSSEKRGIAIARTESTRLANLGAQKHYKDSGVKQYSWVASFGTRTCPTCEALNGQTFNIGQGPLPPEPHGMCRCTTMPVTEILDI